MKLNSLQLKIIAVITMIIDHIAHYLLPMTCPLYWPMRIIGRIAAPIFWFCFAEGLKRTSNKPKYIVRLGMSAAIMGIGNLIISNILNVPAITILTPNIFLTMFLAALIIVCIDKIISTKDLIIRMVLPCLAIVLSIVLCFCADYGILALACMLCFYFINHKVWKCIVFVFISLLICSLQANLVQMFMVFIIVFLVLYTPEKPKHNLKWFFYLFYPIHIWLLILLSTII